MMKETYDLIIIGGGPAGLTAAIYARRANLNVLVIEESSNGGKLSKISKIDNYPGIETISGFDLAQQFINHAKQYNTKIINDKVIKIDNKTVILNSGESYDGKAILVATGSKQRKLDLENADKFEGKGISYCATCDGFFFKNKEVVVIGGSSEALNESLYLSGLVSKLTIVNRDKTLNADNKLIDEINKNDKIKIINNSIAQQIITEDNKIKALEIKNLDTNELITIECVGIFPYISFNPGTDFLDKTILDENGFIKTNQDMSTAIEGIYAAGDCVQKQLRQVVTACSDGAIASSSIIRYLKNKA